MGQIFGYLHKSSTVYGITEIAVVTNEQDCIVAVQRLKKECRNSFPVLGMDCEWVPDRKEKHPVALLQLASISGFCALFRLSHMPHIPDSLKGILMDQNIFKVGVGIENDVCRLRTNVRSWVDIRHLEYLVRSYPVRDAVEEPSGCRSMKLGLAALAKRVLGIDLNKDGNIRFGQWDSDELTEEQISYASWDALAAALICYEITHQDEAIQAYSMNEPIDFLKSIVELHYKSGERKAGRRSPANKGVGSVDTTLKKLHHRLLPKRQTPMYDNIFLLAPDGEILCTCDKKRAMWYVEKGIGELIEENMDPVDDDDLDGEIKTCIKVKLKFEPKRRAVNESEKYYCIVKDNCCVVCGKEDSYLRKHIVPHEYRKYFPVWMKSRQSHDVLLLCINCHVRSNCIDLKLRQKLAEDCQAPLTVAKAIEIEDAAIIKKVQSAARALSRQPENIPPERRNELEDIVLKYFCSQENNKSCPSVVTPELLETALELTYNVVNEQYVPHGLKVVQHFRVLGEEDGIRELEILWRKHFVDEMRPQFLPPMWSTHHLRISPARKELESQSLRQQEEPLDANAD
ncbi:exonuclease 3'-5' domain-containing protein 2 isoform X2 [Hetaerina americana]|uniref:exonuclease 3'-5' domain-containing protein 2 isoform X2 n=1 Tax=Hetaerina americana TaxID=62018 RepID=UPI003A7F1564